MADLKTQEGTIEMLSARSKDEDNFKVKLTRRRQQHALPEHICTLGDASVQHIANPETWIPKLCGGGFYAMTVYHKTDTMPIGVPLPFSFQGECRDVDPRVITKADWQGPPTMIFPSLEDLMKAGPGAIAMTAPPSGTNPFSAAPLNPVSGGGTNQTGAPSQESKGSSPELAYQLAQAQARYEALQQQLVNDRAMNERQRSMDLERVKLESDMKLREFEMRIAAQPKTSAPDLASTLAPIIASLAPVFQSILESGKEARLASQKAQEQAQVQNQAMIVALMNRPSVDPSFQSMVERMVTELKASKQDTSPAAQSVATMAEAMQGMTKTALNLFHAAAEIGSGKEPREPPGLMVAKEVAKALASLGNGMAQAYRPGRRPPMGQPRQLQGGQPQAPRPQPPQAQPVPAPAPIEKSIGALDKIEGMIRSKDDPVKVSDAFFEAIKTDDSQLHQELSAVEGDINELVGNRLGAWLMENEGNRDYASNLFGVMQERGVLDGLIDGDDADSDEDSGEDAEPEPAEADA